MKHPLTKTMTLWGGVLLLGVALLAGLNGPQTAPEQAVTSEAPVAPVGTVPGKWLLDALQDDAHNIHEMVQIHLNSPDEAIRHETDQLISGSRLQLGNALHAYGTDGCGGGPCVTDDKGRALLEAVRVRLRDCDQAQLKVLALSRDHREGEGRQLLQSQLIPAEVRLDEAIATLARHRAGLRQARAPGGAEAQMPGGSGHPYVTTAVLSLLVLGVMAFVLFRAIQYLFSD